MHGHDASGLPVVAVAATHRSEQLHALGDALHLAAEAQASRVLLILERPAIATLESFSLLRRAMGNRGPHLVVHYHPDQVKLPKQPISGGNHWVSRLMTQESAPKPLLAARLDHLLGAYALDWYPPFSSGPWSGRVAGLQICTVEGEAGSIAVGTAQDDKPAGEVQEQVAAIIATVMGAPKLKVSVPASVTKASREVELLKALVQARLNLPGPLNETQAEHRLEARIRRGEIKLGTTVCSQLEYVRTQFPTRWANGGNTRFLDVMMRCRSIPWAVELKVATGGQGLYLRRAVVQSTLYREFIRQGADLNPWFQHHGLERTKCEALLVIPKIGGPHAKQLAGAIDRLAHILDVHVIDDRTFPTL
jgi:hypothetical protein